MDRDALPLSDTLVAADQGEAPLALADGQASLCGAARRHGGAVPRIVLVGMMGAGKSCIGRMLAAHYGLPFVDADTEIEASAGLTTAEIFERYGEAAFRDGERKVIARLLDGGPQVLATGGGAFMDPRTRALIKERALSLWLRAELDVLFRRTARRNHRPLLRQGDPRETLARLIDQRYPIYADADLVIDSEDVPAEQTAAAAIAAIDGHLGRDGTPGQDGSKATETERTEGAARHG